MDNNAEQIREALMSEQPTQEATPQPEVVTETPQVETPAAESPAVETAPAPQLSFEEKIKEERSKWQKEQEELLAKTREEAVNSAYASDQIKKLNELAKEGVDITSPEFLKFQSLDVNNYTPDNPQAALELIRLKAQTENPYLSPEDVKGMVEHKYKELLNPDEYMDEEVAAKRYEYLAEFGTAKSWAEQEKQKYTLPNSDIQKQREEEARKAEEANKLYRQGVTTSLKDFNAIELSVGDKPLSYEISAGVKEQIQDYMISPTDFMSKRYAKKDGTVDYEKMRSDMAWIVDRENMVKTALQNASATATEEVIDTIENPSSSAAHSAPPNSSKLSYEERLAVALQKKQAEKRQRRF